MEDLRLCTVEHFSTIRRRFCFKVVSPKKSYMVAADSEETRLTWTRAIKNVALVSQPRPDDSEKWSHQEEPSAPGAPDLRESLHGFEPPCNEDFRTETTGTGALDPDQKSTGTCVISRASSPCNEDLSTETTGTGALDPDHISTGTCVTSRASSPCKEDLSTETTGAGALDPDHISTGTCVTSRTSSPCKDLEDNRTGSPLVQISISPSNDCIWTKYIIGDVLGEGGFGLVYAGVCKADGRKVAIKFIRKKSTMRYITIPGEDVPLPSEVALMLMVSQSPRCDHIIELLEWYDHPKYLMLVLERPSPCMDLATFINAGPLDEDIAQAIMAQVILAMEHCTERGVLHRDIKIQNILVNPDDLKIKVIDFGCGDLLQTTPYREFAGTSFLVPPELIWNHQYFGCPATVWSLGILLYVLLCGDVPFKTESQLLKGDLKFKRDLSAACCHLIRSCLAKKPENRLSLEELLDHEWFDLA